MPNEEQKEVWERETEQVKKKKSEIKANRRGKEREKKNHKPPNKLSRGRSPLQKKKIRNIIRGRRVKK